MKWRAVTDRASILPDQFNESATAFATCASASKKSPLLAGVLCFFLCPLGMFYFGWKPGLAAALVFVHAHWVASDVLTTWITPPWVKPLVFFTWAYAGWRHAASWNAERPARRRAVFGSFGSGISTTVFMVWIHVLLSFPVIAAFVVVDNCGEGAGSDWLLLLLAWSGAGIGWFVLGIAFLVPWMRVVGYSPVFGRRRRSVPAASVGHTTTESESGGDGLREDETVIKDGRVKGMEALITLLAKAGVECAGEDLMLLAAEETNHELHKDRLDKLFDGIFRGFFVCAAEGITFVPAQRIVDAFGKTLEQNYPEAGEAWLRFAKTYWTLKLLLSDIENDSGWIGAGLLGMLETDVASVFVPMPGPYMIPPSEREKTQRKILNEFAPAIDVEDFVRGNPILIRDRLRTEQREVDTTG